MTRRRGSIIFSYLVIMVFLALGAAIILRGANEAKVTQRHSNSTQAFWTGEAGIQKGLWDYKNNSCQGFVQSGTATACTSCTNCGGGNKTMAGTISNSGDYDVTINSANTTMSAVGSYPSRTSTSKITRSVQVTLATPPLFGYGAFAQGAVNLDNNVEIDSYNSTLNGGVYDLTNNRALTGDVGTNGTTAGIIHLDNNAKIYGAGSTAAGGTVTLDNGASVSGGTSATNSVTLSPVDVPDDLESLTGGTPYATAKNGSATLPQGNYKYTSLTLTQGSTLTVTGNVNVYLTSSPALTTGNNAILAIDNGASITIYTDGTVTFDNNSVINNNSLDPSKFIIYSAYTGNDGVHFSNNGSVYGAIYAPQTDVDVENNGAFFGAVVGETIDFANNVKLHYDENLNNLANPFSTSVTLSSWQEI